MHTDQHTIIRFNFETTPNLIKASQLVDEIGQLRYRIHYSPGLAMEE